jgi:hypothetical protein
MDTTFVLKNKFLLTLSISFLLTACGGGSDNEVPSKDMVHKDIAFQSVTELKITGERKTSSGDLMDAAIPTIELLSEGTASTDGYNAEARGSEVSPLIYSPSYSPICTELSINTLYNLTISSGNYYCIYFDITQNSRTEFIALSQNTNRQVNVDVFQDENADYSFTLLESSADTDADDSVIVFTEPGHYYMQMYAANSDGGSISFASASNTAVDGYESNDSISDSHTLTGDVNEILANLDYSGDYDYYRYQSDHGQDLYLSFTDTVGNNQWVIEVLTSGSWSEIISGNEYKLSSLSSGDNVYVRVRQRSGVTYNSASYGLSFGSLIDEISNISADTTENLIRMASGTTTPYYTTQVHNELNWSAKIKDSAGYPMEGVRVEFNYGTEDISTLKSIQYTNASGVASASLTLPDCTGNNSVVHYHSFDPYKGNWETEYDAGAWLIEVPQARGNSEFFGGYEEVGVSAVNMAHICDQTYLP